MLRSFTASSFISEARAAEIVRPVMTFTSGSLLVVESPLVHISAAKQFHVDRHNYKTFINKHIDTIQ